jgi:hypothetical protein
MNEDRISGTATIEAQPYTTALAALGIGWLLGRMHRPL